METREAQARLVGIIRQLLEELHPDTRLGNNISLKSTLDKGLGFDSLSRVELLVRIERTFDIDLPETLIAEAETVEDLLDALLVASPGSRFTPEKISPGELSERDSEAVSELPDAAVTLPEVLAWHGQRHSEQRHIILYGGEGEPEDISYGELLAAAERVAGGLQQHGLQPGETVAIMLPTGRDYLHSFFGILLAGGIPVPIYPPLRLSQVEDHIKRHVGILDNAGSVLMITLPKALTIARLLRSHLKAMRDIVTLETLVKEGGPPDRVVIEEDDIAFLQYTSGSTGQPKGVMLSHRHLLANIRAMGEAIQVRGDDCFISWLPLYHDMGLIGAWLGSLYYGIPLVLMSPLRFLARPSRWLWAIHKHRGTLSAAPNFAYELCIAKVSDEEIEGLDLSSWRMAFNGAEPVSPHTLERFNSHYSAYGFRQDALSPVYGLAEAAVGLAFPPPGRGPHIDRIERDVFLVSGEARVAKEGDEVMELVACGRPLPGYQIRVVDGYSRELPERHQGRIQFQGPSATRGYYRNRKATAGLFDNDWLETGDLGYIAEGDLYLASRSKEIIIRGGRNLYPYETEEAVGGIEGIRKGCVALFGSKDSLSGTERLVLVAETRETDKDILERLREQVRDVATDLLSMPPDTLLLVPPHTVLKTSSGKIRRGAVRELFEQDRLGEGELPGWRLYGKLFLSSLPPLFYRMKRVAAESLRGRYVQTLFWLIAPLVWLLVAIAPGLKLRWSVIRAAARLFLKLAGYPLRVAGQENLPAGSAAVYVANHASYLDGIALAAALPEPIGFIAKAELGQQLIAGIFLRRIKASFVERFNKQQGREDAGRVAASLQEGQSLFYFPEGTLIRTPGLLPFRMGAFVAAADAGVPVIPVVIRGTRSILRSGSWFPHPGSIQIDIAQPLVPTGTGWSAATHLRDASRHTILTRLGEPDLASEISLFNGGS